MAGVWRQHELPPDYNRGHDGIQPWKPGRDPLNDREKRQGCSSLIKKLILPFLRRSNKVPHG